MVTAKLPAHAIVTFITAKTSRIAFFTGMTHEREKWWRVTGTDRHQVSRIVHVRATDHDAAKYKASQSPHALIVVRSCVLMEEILRRWRRFPLRNRPWSAGLVRRRRKAQ
jgi:hypothetical protein